MSRIDLTNLKLKTFTEQNVLDYCLINNINSDNIIILDLSYNQLTDISGIKLFKNLKSLVLSYNLIENILVIQYLNNLKSLYINNNQIEDISIIQDLTNLKILDINNLRLESDQIQYIKSLKILFCRKGFKDMSVLNQLNKNIQIIK